MTRKRQDQATLVITTAVKLQELAADVNLTQAQQDLLRKARAITAADQDLPDGEKPAEYLGSTADGGEEFRVSWADER